MTRPTYTFPNGYYDDNGRWQRTKFCVTACQRCDCGPPGRLYYSVAHDKRLNAQDNKPKLESKR